MEFFNDHKKLFITAAALFILLTLFVAIMPALDNQARNAPLPNAEPLSEDAIKGKAIYVANGCVACHTQQVRTVEMDKVWGSRPSIASDYANMTRPDIWRNTATLMGTERTGPDLIDIGNRQPSLEWNLLHLFNPRAVVKESIMPAYSWMFEYKQNPGPNDVVVAVPEAFIKHKNAKVVAKEEALQLVAYLQSLKQAELPSGMPTPEFLYERAKKMKEGASSENGDFIEDGVALYATHCQACHQENGEGLPGAFPPLKGSSIVQDDDPSIFVDIIMNGYNGRASEGYGPMAPVGTLAGLTAAELAAIMNHERTNWGNTGKKVTKEEVQKIMDSL